MSPVSKFSSRCSDNSVKVGIGKSSDHEVCEVSRNVVKHFFWSRVRDCFAVLFVDDLINSYITKPYLVYVLMKYVASGGHSVCMIFIMAGML